MTDQPAAAPLNPAPDSPIPNPPQDAQDLIDRCDMETEFGVHCVPGFIRRIHYKTHEVAEQVAWPEAMIWWTAMRRIAARSSQLNIVE